MTLSKLIQDAQEKGLMAVAPLKIRGSVKATFDWIDLMANTRPIERLESGDFNQSRN